jgi:CheY-like chemotaxis protein/HPt (histidine-containing phosphotransfer) domain-containing protein
MVRESNLRERNNMLNTQKKLNARAKIEAMLDIYENPTSYFLEDGYLKKLNLNDELPILKEFMETIFDTLRSHSTEIEGESRNEYSKSLSILAAEDSPVNQLILRGYLKDSPHRLIMVSNGFEALELAKKQRFDLFIFDLQMPHMDGPTALREIKNLGDKWAKIPSIILTAFVKESDKSTRVDGICDVFLGKPFKREALMDAIKQATSTNPSSDTNLKTVVHDLHLFKWNYGHLERSEIQLLITEAIEKIDADIKTIEQIHAKEGNIEVDKALHRLAQIAESLGFLALSRAAHLAKKRLPDNSYLSSKSIFEDVAHQGETSLAWLKSKLLTHNTIIA